MDRYKVAVIGVGMVGEQIISILRERDLPIEWPPKVYATRERTEALAGELEGGARARRAFEKQVDQGAPVQSVFFDSVREIFPQLDFEYTQHRVREARRNMELLLLDSFLLKMKELSAEEIQAHENFLEKIDDPIWRS